MPADTTPLNLTPSDIIGAVKQGCEEMHGYLSRTPVLEVDGGVCQAHLDRLAAMIGMVAPARVRSNGEDAGASDQTGREARAG
jgi:hypothetical protein